MFSSNQDRSGRCNAFQGLCRAAISSPELFHFHVTSTNLSQHKFTTLKRPKSSGSGCDMTENIKSQNLSLRTTGGSLACCTKLAIASAVPNSYDLRRSPARRHSVFAISKRFSSRSEKEHHGRISVEIFWMLRATWPPVWTAGTGVLQGRKYAGSCRQSIRLDGLFMFLSQERVLGAIHLGVAERAQRRIVKWGQ
jgi:hypothetical protein